MKNVLGILPESIAGRLIISGLLEGFRDLGYNIDIFDKLYNSSLNFKNIINSREYYFLISYDYVAIEYKVKYNLDVLSVNYFSDVIKSNLSGKYWKKYYKYLNKPNNYVFYWDKVLTESLINKLPNIYYLPHGVNTKIYRNINIEKEYDIMFAGRLTFENRLKFLKLIENNFPNNSIAIYSYQKHFDEIMKLLPEAKKEKFKSFYKGFIETEEDMARAINKARVVINFTSQGKSNLNYRLFQTLACETFLLTDYRLELEELFTPGKDIIYYESEKDLINKLGDYLLYPENYQEIIKSGRKTVKEKYSNKIAAKKILEALNYKQI